ncbi:hypothetical protein ACQ86O_27190 (plasmid) [Serratia sp. L9]|uniref:hypothetical protein n=1 Tax=Serratia sp. L9 TaxID=3423946 RepID=UPI003D67265D
MTEAQLTLAPLSLDISGDPQTPVPQPMDDSRCQCCGLHINKLWQGARAGFDESHAVCTLCYLTGHLDSSTAAHARLVWLPGVSLTNALHLQRQTLLAMITGTRAQQREGKRLWRWMVLHAREVEGAWGTARVGNLPQPCCDCPQSSGHACNNDWLAAYLYFPLMCSMTCRCCCLRVKQRRRP